jgi:nitroimidazol reductase NimA-like FMN-containing flavoprotein (pyridoxamine 5'-phosphate oxidase superfamily)
LLKKNPKVWGLVVLDQGFGDGQCVNLYASVMFSGKVEFVEEQKAKHDVLIEFAKKTNKNHEPTIQRLEKMTGTDNELLKRAALGRIKIETLTCKRSTEMTVERLLEITKK